MDVPTVVYINSITVTGDVVGPFTFDADATPLTLGSSLEGQQLGYVADAGG